MAKKTRSLYSSKLSMGWPNPKPYTHFKNAKFDHFFDFLCFAGHYDEEILKEMKALGMRPLEGVQTER
jgi:hypothetical protein